ncbi:MAG: TetR/AcrR family transcriptional regulator [Desulfofustis sp.]|jgi:AcrR family transcriptional regulator|nr:TetR/AcrR family transcriptional regulator [Desulfofustis sp.]
MTSRREKNKRKTRKCILDSAVRLFSRKGFDKTSIEELAREAGIGKGTVYSYFRTKRDIVKAFCDDQLEFARSELAAKTNPDMPLIEQLMIIFMADFKYVTENKEFGRVYLHEKVFPQEPLAEEDFQVQNDYFDMLYPIYQRAQDRGELRKDLELLHISGHIYAVYLLMLSCWYTGMIPTEEIGEAMKVMVTQTIQGLKP